MHTNFDIFPDGPAWVVRCHSAEYGRYISQIQAFNAAVFEARKIKETGRLVHVRVMRDESSPQADYVSLL
jgi:hypothetical protein